MMPEETHDVTGAHNIKAVEESDIRASANAVVTQLTDTTPPTGVTQGQDFTQELEDNGFCDLETSWYLNCYGALSKPFLVFTMTRWCSMCGHLCRV